MPNPWLSRRVLNYAHQGGALEAPSSTLHALHRAVESGASALELDVHLTRDEHVVVAHDATVDRLTDGTGAISSKTLAELRTLDAAHRYSEAGQPDVFPFRGRGPADPQFRIPTLDEVLDAFPDAFLNFDVKASESGSHDCARALARALRSRSCADRVIVASFDDALTETVSIEAPELGTSAGTATAMAVWQAVHERAPLPSMKHIALQLPARFQDADVVTAALIARAHEANLAVHVWTVNEPDEMARLIDLGVDGVITNRPSVLAPLLRERGLDFRR